MNNQKKQVKPSLEVDTATLSSRDIVLAEAILGRPLTDREVKSVFSFRNKFHDIPAEQAFAVNAVVTLAMKSMSQQAGDKHTTVTIRRFAKALRSEMLRVHRIILKRMWICLGIGIVAMSAIQVAISLYLYR